MSLHKDKSNNTWYVKYKTTTKRGFKTKKEAKQYEEALSDENYQRNFSTNLSTISNHYLDDVKVNSSYSTFLKYHNIINKIILPNIDNKIIVYYNELDCVNFRNKLATLNYSTSYKNNVIGVFKRLFKYAIKFRYINNDPTIYVEKFKKTFQDTQKKINKEKQVWTYEEFNKFINHVNNSSYQALFTTLFFTGMRLGEALALTWNDIDFENKVIDINKSLSRKTNTGSYVIKLPKTYTSIRKISINDSLISYLKNYHSIQINTPGYNDTWFVFGKVNPLPQTSIDRIKDNAIKKANIKRITIHDFRHSHASILISQGCNIVAVSKRLGHNNIEMTLKTYTHLLKKNDEELVNIVEESSQNLLKIFSI